MRMVAIFIWSHLYYGIEEKELGDWEEILTETPADFPHSLAVLILEMEKWLFRLSYCMFLFEMGYLLEQYYVYYSRYRPDRWDHL